MSHVWLIVCWRLLQSRLSGPVAQLVEQRIENPRVGSSILPQATSLCGVAQENVLQISVART